MNPGNATVVWLNAPGQLELRTESLRPPGDREVLCETLVTAISPGTELAAFKGLPPLRPGVVYPRLQGYCNVARVLACGTAVTSLQPGDRVLSFSSHRSAFVAAEDEILFKLPDEARADHIACTYLFHLGYNAVLRAGVRAGSRVLVIGLGALGLTTVAMAALAGARVFALSDQAQPAALARQMGAEAVFGRAELPALKQALGPDLADVVVSTTNGWSDWEAALQAAGRMGVIAVLGFPGRGEAPPGFNPLDSQHFYMKQLRIEAVGMSPERPDSRGFCRFNERANLDYLAGLIAAGRLDPTPIISGTYAGTDIGRAYADLIARRSSPITYLLTWNNS
ncbi:zinc-dependent alcohol dehydrogenase [Noviherbaspirillum aridicola]|uniref:Zinc-binding dehydrogenase n=1 Tax=Noviherbaspirillum aridicola TaxID=2849687 RepID=A0ABQ4Q290_9BURK|nr:zinc-binding alcohol dehydrogenase [Noviherbaspirillum aridicola]GIZ51303.1 zinc-binding dehydrogenase [Noviherbaspirillum aridicola]